MKHKKNMYEVRMHNLFAVVSLCLSFVLHHPNAVAGAILTDSTKLLLKTIAHQALDSSTVRAHINLGNYLVRKLDAGKQQLDSANNYFNRALYLARRLNMPELEYRCISSSITAKAIINNDTAGIHNRFHELITKFRGIHDFSGEAEAWTNYGDILILNPEGLLPSLRCYTAAKQLYLKLDHKFGVAVCQRHIGSVYTKLGRLNESAAELLNAYRYFKTAGKIKEQIGCEVDLAGTYWKMGNTQQALYFNSEAYKTARSLNDDFWISVAANSLGRQYFNMEMYAEALPVMERSLALTLKTKAQSDYAIAILNVISARVKLKKTNGLLEFLVQADHRMPSVLDLDRINIYCAYGLVYNAIGQPSEAEKWFLKMIRTYDALEKSKAFGNNGHLFLQAYYKTVGEFYISINQGEKARPYFERVMALPSKFISPASASDVHMALYQIDSAAGHYVSGIRHLRIYNRIHDSLFNASSSNALAALNARYSAEQRSQELAVSKARQKSQAILMQKTKLERNITLAGIAAVLIIAGVAYWAYRKKQVTNRRLQYQSARIDHQNVSLKSLLEEKELLLADKEVLISEKDWLLKEVHHRVKNNLQIITSLLNFQTSSTSKADVLDAIKISRNRIQAISLIHLKLSNSSNLASLNMHNYVSDLITHLKDIFVVPAKKVTFKTAVEPVEVGLKQAVPIGLILNEAITNSIKYAFDEKGGEISVVLKLTGEQQVLLEIADNGKGYPDDIEPATQGTLGFKIVHGLVAQLKGDIRMENIAGTMISISFPLKTQTGPGVAQKVAIN